MVFHRIDDLTWPELSVFDGWQCFQFQSLFTREASFSMVYYAINILGWGNFIAMRIG